jgi:hypothetical protein
MNLRLLIPVACAAILAYSILFTTPVALTEWQVLGAAVIVVLGFVPAMVSLADATEARLTPLMTLHGLFYAFTFGLPALSEKTVWYSSPDSITEALILAILGLACLYAGYYAFRSAFRSVRPIRFVGNVSPDNRKWIAWILFGVYVAFHLFPSLGAIPSINMLSEPLVYLSLGILVSTWLDGRLARGHFPLLVGALAATFVIKLLSGSLAQPVLFIVFLGILYWNQKRRLPWRMIATSVAIVVLLNPIKMTYRGETWNIDPSALGFVEKAELFWESAETYYLDAERPFIEDASTVNRLAHIAILSYVVEMTPDPVPYWLGGSYRTLLTSFIPRLLWPDKPQSTIGQEFGHRYLLLNDTDEATSFNLPWLPEFYANFGIPGVLFGMFGVGVLFRFLVQKFTAPASRTFEYVLGVTLTFQLFYAESNFALMIGGLLLTYIAVAIILKAISFGTRPAAAGAS